jgi:hypothetical protein
MMCGLKIGNFFMLSAGEKRAKEKEKEGKEKKKGEKGKGGEKRRNSIPKNRAQHR